MQVLSFVVLTFLPLSLAYSLVDDYTSNNYSDFFTKFSFWDTSLNSDPTHGFVQYVSEDSAWDKGLIGNGGNIYLGVDDKNTNQVNGRAATRLTSSTGYQSGTLIVADIAHMPGGICGTWPAFWLTSEASDWPQEGEIDVIEEANNAANNQMSLHVSKQQGACTISTSPSMTATKDRWGDCTQENTGGCDANDFSPQSFGTAFNTNGGGIYALDWTSSYIHIYFFPRSSSIPSGPSGPLGAAPDPSKWGTPATSFEGSGCNLDNHVKNQHIIINTDFCGDWASGTWSSSGCAASTGVSTCQEYVQDNPTAFTSAFWTFNSLSVFQ
ncbi:hypothetical protein B7494_g2862 [Chlorociboria aeruginascens]|nr:hypothetical protein B7494_g2862 [Chlorociboria aeruginascens]